MAIWPMGDPSLALGGPQGNTVAGPAEPPAVTAAPWVHYLARACVRQRAWILGGFALLSIAMGLLATQLRADAGFTKMIPLQHPFMQVFMKYEPVFGGANRVLVAMHPKQGDIFNEESLRLLRSLTEDVFFVPGVERSSVTSIFTPNVRFTEVVEEGFRGGNIVSSDFDGRPQQIEQVRVNLAKSDWAGRIVSDDGTAALVLASLQERDPVSDARLNLREVADAFEEIRSRHESDHHSIHIIGFAKAVGDIADGAAGVLVFFALAFAVISALLWLYTGSTMLTVNTLGCALVPVVLLLGLMPLLGWGLDPMSILAPFLIFAIAVSHAVQMTNAWRIEFERHKSAELASERCFCDLLLPGSMALVSTGLGFLVIAFVQIEVVRELALIATLGVLLIVFSNSALLPALLSYRNDAAFSPVAANRFDWLWHGVSRLACRGPAVLAVFVCLGILSLGLWIAKDRQVGDLGKGVPELRADSRYNQDAAFITSKFALGLDVMQVIVEAKGEDSPCVNPAIMGPIEEFELAMQQNPVVSAVSGLPSFAKTVSQAYAENNLKWWALPEDPTQLAQGVGAATRLGNTLMNPGCTAMPVSVFTMDHQAPTISALVQDVEAFAKEFNRDDLTFSIGLGNLSVMAATNQVVLAADPWVNAALFGSVAALCLLAFRSFRITLCIIIPLGLVTVLCNAVMVLLDIGLKVNTLPVVALGVGVGVDYGIYLFERIRAELMAGRPLQQAVFWALRQRGVASLFTAAIMTVSVLTWLGSDLQFQADMGVLLGFMFLVNLLGALILLPALAAFLVSADRRLGPAQ